MSSTRNVPQFYNSNPVRSMIHHTHPAALDAMANDVKTHCQVGKDAAACHDAVVRYASHNQAAASGVYAPSKPAPTVVTKLVQDISPTHVINATTYGNLVRVSNAQAAKEASTGEFNMWTADTCNPCYYPTTALNTASF